MDEGVPVNYGNVEETILKYHEITRQKRLEKMKINQGFQLARRTSSGEIIFHDGGVLDKSGKKTNRVEFGDDIRLFFEFELQKDIKEMIFSVGVLDERGIICLWQKSIDIDNPGVYNLNEGKYRLCVNFKAPNLCTEIYRPSFAIGNQSENYLKKFI